MWCDFHLHSDRSDGAHPPADVMDMAADAGVRILALTDHDTTDGLREARERALERGLAFVNGIEMTAYASGRVVHVLGLGIREDDAVLARANAVAMRVWENNERRWLRALQAEGFAVSEASVLADAPVRLPVLIERLCLAGVDAGDPGRCYERFKRFFAALGDAAYADLPSPARAALIIRGAGGVAALAHPARLEDAGLATELAGDVDAIEAVYAHYSESERSSLVALARRLGKLHTCGSDFHGHFGREYVNPRFAAPPELLMRLGITP